MPKRKTPLHPMQVSIIRELKKLNKPAYHTRKRKPAQISKIKRQAIAMASREGQKLKKRAVTIARREGQKLKKRAEAEVKKQVATLKRKAKAEANKQVAVLRKKAEKKAKSMAKKALIKLLG